MAMTEQKGLLLKRKDYLGVDEEAGSHPNRTYYYKKSSDLENVITTCTKSLEVDPYNLKALLLRGNTLLKLQQYDDASQDFTYLIELDPTSLEGYYGRGVAYSKIGDHELAIRDLTHVIQRNPDHVNALFARAACYNTIGQFSAAIEDYNIALLKDHSQNVSRANPSPEKIRRSSFSGSISSRVDDAPPSPPIRSRTPIVSKIPHSHQSVDSQQLSPPTHPPPPAGQTYNKRSPLSSSTADEYHKRGFEFRKQGNFSQAVVEYSRALEVDPHHFKAYFNRAFAYDKLNEYRLAIADYTSAISLDRMNSYAYYNRGITYDKLGEFQQACDDFQQALSLQSENIDFLYNLALSYKKLNNLPEAVKHFNRCLSIDPNHLKSLQSMGSCLERIEKYDEALSYYDTALQIAPQNISTLISKANLLHSLGGEENYHLSIRLYSSILDLLYPDGTPVPRHAGAEKRREEAISIIYSRAHVYEDLNDFKSCIRDLTLAIELATQSNVSPPGGALGPLREGLNAIPLSVLYSTRGIYYKSLEKYQLAIDDFNLFFKSGKPHKDQEEVNATYASVFNHRGYCYRKLERYSDAIADYSEAICLQPANIKGYNNRAYCYAKIGEYDKAIHDYTSVISIDERNAHAYHNRGISYDKLGIFDKAIEDFSKVIELDASNHPYSANSPPTIMTAPASGRSTPGMFTPIRTNETTSSHVPRIKVENRAPNSRSQTPTAGLKREGKGSTVQSARFTKSPTPITPRSSLQETIRAKMVPSSPHDQQVNSQRSTLSTSNVQDQIIGIQDAARRLASLSLPKTQKSRPTTPNSQMPPTTQQPVRVSKLNQSDRRQDSQVSLQSDGNSKYNFSNRSKSMNRFLDTGKFDKL